MFPLGIYPNLAKPFDPSFSFKESLEVVQIEASVSLSLRQIQLARRFLIPNNQYHRELFLTFLLYHLEDLSEAITLPSSMFCMIHKYA